MSVCVLGSINLDIVCRVARLPAPGETIPAEGVERLPGGKGANQAVACARWGAAAALIGAVGRDEAAEPLLAHLRAAGVDVAGVARIAGQPTGQAHIFVSAAGENMIVVIGGANKAVGAEHVRPGDLGRHRVFLTQFETPLGAIEALFAGAGDALKILNAAPAVAQGEALFPLADILVVNQTELARYAGAGDPPVSAPDVERAARALISRSGQTVVVTLGAAGAVAVDGAGAILVAGRPARVVDTTGAGDCFCGVLAASLSEGASLEDALGDANAAASLSTERPGAAVSPTLRTEVGAIASVPVIGRGGL